MPIFLASTDVELTITHVHGNDGIIRRLHDLGIVKGAEVRLISQDGKAVILALQGARIALDPDMSARIMVG